MREWEIGAVENIHGALPYIRFAPILALVGVGVNRIGKLSCKFLEQVFINGKTLNVGLGNVEAISDSEPIIKKRSELKSRRAL